MTPLLPSGAFVPFALLPAHAGITASAPTLTLVESPRLPRYKFPVAKQVYVTVTSYDFEHGGRKVEAEKLHQIASRQRLPNRNGGYTNWYTMVGFPFMFPEDKLSLKARYKTYQTQAVAAA
jgi:hypothetical protein